MTYLWRKWIFDFVGQKFAPKLRSNTFLKFYCKNISRIAKVHIYKVMELDNLYLMLPLPFQYISYLLKKCTFSSTIQMCTFLHSYIYNYTPIFFSYNSNERPFSTLSLLLYIFFMYTSYFWSYLNKYDFCQDS